MASGPHWVVKASRSAGNQKGPANAAPHHADLLPLNALAVRTGQIVKKRAVPARRPNGSATWPVIREEVKPSA